jgi:hypothetical protein
VTGAKVFLYDNLVRDSSIRTLIAAMCGFTIALLTSNLLLNLRCNPICERPARVSALAGYSPIEVLAEPSDTVSEVQKATLCSPRGHNVGLFFAFGEEALLAVNPNRYQVERIPLDSELEN